MRITFVLPHADQSGGIRVCSIYANFLHAKGHQVQVVSVPLKDLKPIVKLKNFFRGKPWRIDRFGKSHFDQTDVPHKILEVNRPICDKDVPDADVVVATWWETAHWVSQLSDSKGVKTHLIQHDETQMSNQNIERVDSTWKLPMHRAVVAQWLANLGKDRFGVNNIRVVPNGVNGLVFHASARGKQRVPTLGVMYSPVYFKGCDIALEAFRIARSRIPNLRLLSFGSHNVGEWLELPEGASFELSPAQARIAEIYASCDGWLFASRTEGFGLPILEAMSCRTPVIGVPSGAAPELLAEGRGILVKPQDPIDMSVGIQKFVDMDEASWRAMSEKVHEFAQKQTWESCATQFEQFLIDAYAKGQAS